MSDIEATVLYLISAAFLGALAIILGSILKNIHRTLEELLKFLRRKEDD